MDQKVRGLLSYLFGWVGGLVVLLGFKDNTKETNFHAAQAITLSVSYIVLTIALSIISGIITGILYAIVGKHVAFITIIFGLIRTVVGVGYIVLAIMGMIKSYQEKQYEIPVISDLTKIIFKSKLA